MAYTNTGYQRATTLTIITFTSGVQTASDILPFMYAFTGYAVIPGATVVEQKDYVAKMTTTDYNARVSAYAAYVQSVYQSQYPGLVVTGDGARVLNTTACPLP